MGSKNDLNDIYFCKGSHKDNLTVQTLQCKGPLLKALHDIEICVCVF